MLAEEGNHRAKWEELVRREAIEMDAFMILEQEIFNGEQSELSFNKSHKDIDNDFADYSETGYIDRDLEEESSVHSLEGINHSVSIIDLNGVQLETMQEETVEEEEEIFEPLESGIDQGTSADLHDKYRESLMLVNDLQVKNNILQSENQLVLERLKSLENSLLQKELQTNLLSQENENLKKVLKNYKKQIKAAEILPTRKERLEIELLNSQLKDQQEQAKARESRLLSTQERQRKKIIELESKNKELMGEISILERDRAAMIQVSIKSNLGQPAKSKPTSNQFPKNLKGLKDLEIKSNVGVNTILPRTKSSSDLPRPLKKITASAENQNILSKNASTEYLFGPNIAVEEIPARPLNPSDDPSNTDLDTLQEQLCLGLFISQEVLKDKSLRRTYPDSTILTRLPDGTMKLQRPDIKVTYYTNGDSKSVLDDGTIIFWYNSVKTRHTTLPDKTEICEFEDGQVERKYPDGTLTVQFPDETIKLIEADGTEKIKYPNGNQQVIEPNGTIMNSFPDGREEIIVNDVSTMKYRNGIIKISYPNGFQETRWPTGQVRLKDGTVLT